METPTLRPCPADAWILELVVDLILFLLTL